jgi:hypothetical protein
MTITAHNVRRIYRGATKQPLDSPTPQDRFSLRVYAPWLYKNKPRRPPPSQHMTAIREWLTANGPASAHTIAAALGYGDYRSTLAALGKMQGVVVVGEEMRKTGRTVKVWGLTNGISE